MFPYEYQRALKQLAESEASAQPVPESPKAEKPTAPVQDIEETVTDAAMEKKRLEKILDKTRYALLGFWATLAHHKIQILFFFFYVKLVTNFQDNSHCFT